MAPGPPKAVKTPRLAANPVGNRAAASVCFHRARSLSRVGSGQVANRRSIGPIRHRFLSDRAHRERLRSPRDGGQAQIIVGCKRNDGRSVGQVAVGPVVAVEVLDGAPTALGLDGFVALARPLSPCHAAATSSMDSATAWTMRSISASVVVSGGIITTTSPSGRIRTPRAMAPAGRSGVRAAVRAHRATRSRP